MYSFGSKEIKLMTIEDKENDIISALANTMVGLISGEKNF
jgi:hypothetical protein